MSFVKYKGKILKVDGKFAKGKGCCCGPEKFKDCCVQLQDGDFNVDGDLVYTIANADAILTVIVIMPIKNTRLLCGDPANGNQSLTIYSSVEWITQPTPDTTIDVRWDGSYEYVDSVPAPDQLWELGLAKYVLTSGAIGEANDVFTDFNFNICAAEFQSGNEINVTHIETGLVISILGLFQNNGAELCCTFDHECEDCCVFLEEGDWYESNGKLVKSIEDNGWRAYLTVVLGPTPENSTYCVGTQLNLEYKVVPPNSAEPAQDIKMDWTDLKNSNPPQGTDECSDTDTTNGMYMKSFLGSWECECGGPGSVDFRYDGGLLLSFGNDSEICTITDCCCKMIAPCCNGCYFPIADENGDGEATIEDFYAKHTSGANFIEIEQSGPATMLTFLADLSPPGCPEYLAERSGCVWNVPVTIIDHSYPGANFPTNLTVDIYAKGHTSGSQQNSDVWYLDGFTLLAHEFYGETDLEACSGSASVTSDPNLVATFEAVGGSAVDCCGGDQGAQGTPLPGGGCDYNLKIKGT